MDEANAGTNDNPYTKHYQVSPGHPRYETRSRFLGELGGSWHDIGHQAGSRAGDLVRWVSDVWWKEHMDRFGLDDTMQAISLYEAQIAALSSELVDFMRGLANGAAPELDKSPYARVSSHYHKIVNTNIFDAWSWRHPVRPGGRPGDVGCSSFVTVGSGPNRGDEMIAAHNRHCPFNPKCYQLVYIARPTGANAFWVLTPGGAGAGCQVVNEKGVSLILNAGGSKSQENNGNAFGVPWFMLFPYVAAYASTADEALEMITKGTPEYRENAGRNSLLRTGTWNFLVSDAASCAVIETSCDRYAIRRPGDLGEIGNYLVMTNHNYCNHSFDENNERTDFPMTLFGDEEASSGSAKRFWTLMWDLRHNYGEIDLRTAMQFMRGHHQHDPAGNRIQTQEGETPLQFTGDVSCPHSGYPETWERGTADAKIAVVGDTVSVHWTLGRPCEWQGEWDRVELPSAG